MARDPPRTSVKDAVHKIQSSLIESSSHAESKLLAAGSLLSHPDYDDVVVERSISGLCGYPVCGRFLPSDRPRKGRYRISLSEHRVYDLQETYKYCSSGCLVSSRAFSSSLEDGRPVDAAMDPAKIDRVMRMFEGLSLGGRDGDLGMSKVKITEKSDRTVGEAPFEEWVGPPNAIEGGGCAAALAQAAEAAASGELDADNAVAEAGLVIIPPPVEPESKDDDDDDDDDGMDIEMDRGLGKWPKKPVLLDTDVFDTEDSWHDAPPEGFSLTMSPFGTMWMALFGWVTCSSVAYVYGRDESSCEEFLSVNGREYPYKIVLGDGRSAEIKQTLAGCIARVLPGLVSDLRLPTLPALTQHLSSRRMLQQRVLSTAEIGADEYEVMKDLVIPLGRMPRFSAQSGA
ncbi:hypothetical protein QJS10_CPB04g01066 [Acorus calamus]|uniref:RNA polymerase II subunit B1 CTD phosphatase RPAP2 homolog n=1 Tax=Acorus calamus TaxID=4465 RepID=A0AAV9EZG7_ACOCL|nr:hypothetical protein QJS10_CPB04g01066 [Acorus calamus]